MIKIGITGSIASGKLLLQEFLPVKGIPYLMQIKKLKIFIIKNISKAKFQKNLKFKIQKILNLKLKKLLLIIKS